MDEGAATYRPETTPKQLVGNPLGEALHPMPSDSAELIRKLGHRPKIDLSKGPTDPATFFEIAQLLDVHKPRQEAKMLAFRIMSMIYRSYERQHPFSKATIRRLNTLGDQSEDLENRYEEVLLNGLHVDAMLLIAWSGMGKSTMIKHALSLQPQVIVHRCYNGRPWFQKQIVYLSIDAPVSASPKGLLLNICSAIDQALGFDGREALLNRISMSASVETLRVYVVKALASHCVGLLHIDDMQRFSDGNELLKRQAMALVISIANSACCSLLWSGTQDALKVVQTNMESVRRVLRRGAIQIRAPLNEEDRFFSDLVKAILKHQVVAPHLESSASLNELLLNMTAGVPGILNSLLVASLEASFVNKKPLTSALIKMVYYEQFGPIKPSIKILNSLRSQPNQGWDLEVDKTLSKFLQGLRPTED